MKWIVLLATLLPFALEARPPNVGRAYKRAEVAALNQALEGLRTPDFAPPNLLKAYQPIYPISRLINADNGGCLVEMTVGTDGRVTEARAEEGDSKVCSHTLFAVREWVFEPAKQGGVPVEVSFSLPFDFRVW
jgi:TonB family protein